MDLAELAQQEYDYVQLPADFTDGGEPEIVMRWFALLRGSDPPTRLQWSFGSQNEAEEYVADLKAGNIGPHRFQGLNLQRKARSEAQEGNDGPL